MILQLNQKSDEEHVLSVIHARKRHDNSRKQCCKEITRREIRDNPLTEILSRKNKLNAGRLRATKDSGYHC